MGLSKNYNYELNFRIEYLDSVAALYLRKILLESAPITEEVYHFVVEQLSKLPAVDQINEPDLTQFHPDKDFLISALPMTKSIERLHELGSHAFTTDDQEEKDCAIHDTALFELEYNSSYEDFKVELRMKFFDSIFISELLNFIGKQGRYFGEVKEWIQRNCQDVPLPSRRDLTGNIQVLYRWIVDLSDGKYLMDRPNYSERIFEAW